MTNTSAIAIPPGLNFTTEWQYPPALNHTFFLDFALEFLSRNDTTRSTVDTLRAAAFQVERPKSPYFGSDKIVVHVGDVIEPDWGPRQSQPRTVGLNCLVCLDGATADDRIFDACDKYTNQSSTSLFNDIQELAPPRFEYTLPTLNRDVEIPENSVGICFFSLYSADKGYFTEDYTIPFPVSQLKRVTFSSPHWRFNASRSNGVGDPTISESPSVSKVDSKSSLGKGEIVGIVMGVVTGVVLAGLLSWVLWRRRMKPKTVVESSDDESRRTVSRNEGVESIELRNRREAEEEEEAPPAYHEVVRPTPEGERT